MKKNIKQKKCELLAPAGGMDQLKAAVQNGADAVYVGGKYFNARINANNFTMEELREAVIYTHLRGVKIYVTLNILIKDEELRKALDYVAALYKMGIDAIIIQDLGLASLIKKNIPKMHLHLSTQGTVYNRQGVETAIKLGFQRVVLARELTLAEIKDTTDLCEIEVFVHGALCMCYSGQCQLSRVIGGRSGNRGECAQPCRLPYTNDKGQTGFFLSPKDLCTIDLVGDLIQNGVASLKIEGRMKSPEYVGEVVRIYRKYIDLYYKNGKYSVDLEDRDALLQIFNRGGFTKGYLEGNPGKKILSGDLSKHQGVYIGKVFDNKEGSQFLDVELNEPLGMGDGVEIRSRELTGNIVTYIKELGGNKYRIGDIKGSVRNGDAIYRISSKNQLDKIKGTVNANNKKMKVNMTFTGIVGEYPELIIWGETTEIKIRGEEILEVANNKPLNEDIVSNQLKKTGDTSFEVDQLVIVLDGIGTMPMSKLNKMRREGLDKYANTITEVRHLEPFDKINLRPLNITVKDVESTVYPSVTKGQCDEYIREHLEEDKVTLNNLGWILEFLQRKAIVYAGKGLNVYNGATQEVLEELGCIVVEPSLELMENPRELMVTEHIPETTSLTDRKGSRYLLEKDKKSGKTNIIFEKN